MSTRPSRHPAHTATKFLDLVPSKDQGHDGPLSEVRSQAVLISFGMPLRPPQIASNVSSTGTSTPSSVQKCQNLPLPFVVTTVTTSNGALRTVRHGTLTTNASTKST
jgi:hypothetical protein